MFFLRKYGVGANAEVYLPIVKRGVVDFAVGADWSPAAGDVKISIDGAAAANIATLPTAVSMGNTAMWKFVFSNAELQGKVILVTVADASTKAVEDTMFIIETYGNAAAKFPTDLGASILSVNASQIGGTGQTGTDIGSYIARIREHTDQLTYTNASMVNAAWTENGSDPTGVPSPTASKSAKLDFMFAHYRGKRTQSSTEEKLFANDDTTVIATKAKADNSTTLTVSKAT